MWGIFVSQRLQGVRQWAGGCSPGWEAAVYEGPAQPQELHPHWLPAVCQNNSTASGLHLHWLSYMHLISERSVQCTHLPAVLPTV
jgi:hypothetical protein